MEKRFKIFRRPARLPKGRVALLRRVGDAWAGDPVDIVTIDRVMTHEVECVSPSHPFCEVVARMANKALSCVVVTEKGRPIGILTERDVVGVVHRMLGGAPLPEIASDIMSCPVITIRETATVHEMMMLVEQERVRRVVVVDSAGKHVGLVTQSDMVRAHAWDLDIAQETVRYLLENAAKLEES